MTVVSTPACSSRIAAVWRRTCGVTFLLCSDGQCVGGVGCVLGEATLERVAGELSAACWWGTAARSGWPARSVSQAVARRRRGGERGDPLLASLAQELTCAPVPR